MIDEPEESRSEKADVEANGCVGQQLTRDGIISQKLYFGPKAFLKERCSEAAQTQR